MLPQQTAIAKKIFGIIYFYKMWRFVMQREAKKVVPMCDWNS